MWPASWCWPSWQDISVPLMWNSRKLLECLHDMRAGNPNVWSKSTKLKRQCLLNPTLGSHRASLPSYSNGHTNQTWYNVGGDYTRVSIPEVRIFEGHLKGWLPHSNFVFKFLSFYGTCTFIWLRSDFAHVHFSVLAEH